MRIILTGGGTGGHLFPLVAVSRKLREKAGAGLDLLYLGSGKKIEKQIIAAEGIKIKNILCGKKRRYFSFLNILDIFKIPVGFIQSLWTLFWFMPDAVFSKGGYASVPVVLAAWIYRIPIVIHESDAAPGTANRWLAGFASVIAVSYPSAEEFFPKSKTVLTGNPVRPEILEGDAEKARERYHFIRSKPTLLVLGGSQGSQAINEAVVKILPELLKYAQVIHQAGENNYEETVHLAAREGVKAGREGYVPVGFLAAEELRDAYAAATVVISRAGASAISEIAAWKKSSILIPLEKAANNHQRMNAYALAKIGAALVLEEQNLGEHLFFSKIKMLLEDEELRRQLAEKIKVFYHPLAADELVEGIIELAK